MTSGADLAFDQENRVIPAEARLIRDFVNTVRYQVDEELLRTPDDLGAWLVDHDLIARGVGLDGAHLELAKTLREGLRAIFEMHAGAGADARALRDLDVALAEVPVRVRFAVGGRFELAPASDEPVRAALATLIDSVRAAIEDETWERLKVCGRHSCRWAYFDHSRNRSSRWCTMAGCGNIVKMNRARSR